MSEDRTPADGGGATEGNETGLDVQASVPAERSVSANDLDSLFELLANRHRRRLLAYLVETDDGVATFSELIDHVAGVDSEDADEREVAISIHHTHLPKLADEGVVEYDDRSETVRYRGGPLVADWLDVVGE